MLNVLEWSVNNIKQSSVNEKHISKGYSSARKEEINKEMSSLWTRVPYTAQIQVMANDIQIILQMDNFLRRWIGFLSQAQERDHLNYL